LLWKRRSGRFRPQNGTDIMRRRRRYRSTAPMTIDLRSGLQTRQGKGGELRCFGRGSETGCAG
jgi:hypothetical protein